MGRAAELPACSQTRHGGMLGGRVLYDVVVDSSTPVNGLGKLKEVGFHVRDLNSTE